MKIDIRRVKPEDKDRIEHIESKATPNLRYLGEVFSEFVEDTEGEFSVAELDGEVVGCGKFTLMPDGSAWLESIRVLPECQGMGVGKQFYRRFFELAREKKVPFMRMYTNVGNAASRGLAERFGFSRVATYRGAYLSRPFTPLPSPGSFDLVTCGHHATQLVMPLRDQWTGFMVMNRTFYAITPKLCAALAAGSKVYEDRATSSFLVLGCRFMPGQALHVGMFGGCEDTCLAFARHRAAAAGVWRLQCIFPPAATSVQHVLERHGFGLEKQDLMVMEVQV